MKFILRQSEPISASWLKSMSYSGSPRKSKNTIRDMIISIIYNERNNNRQCSLCWSSNKCSTVSSIV